MVGTHARLVGGAVVDYVDWGIMLMVFASLSFLLWAEWQRRASSQSR